jgi:hypothetical protein
MSSNGRGAAERSTGRGNVVVSVINKSEKGMFRVIFFWIRRKTGIVHRQTQRCMQYHDLYYEL